MASRIFRFTILVCMIITVVQVGFMIIPPWMIPTYNMALRPGVYVVLAITTFFFAGIDGRPVRKAYDSKMVALMSTALFGMTVLVVVFLFGAGANIMTSNAHVVLRNLWERGMVVILGEVIRYKLIRITSDRNRVAIIAMLTVTLAFGHMNDLRMLLAGHAEPLSFFFEGVFRPLVISSVVSYFAVNGSFIAVVSLSFLWSMASYLLPVLPTVSGTVWSLIISGTAFVSAMLYSFVTDERGQALRIKERRIDKYKKRSVVGTAVTLLIVGAIAAFFMGLFPVYPLAVITDSMTPTFNRGSLVFVERVPASDVQVNEGYVIHFTARSGIDYVHRVIEVRHGLDGERQFITRGDASEIPDLFPVSQGDVLGIVRASMPLAGYPSMFVRAVLGVFS